MGLWNANKCYKNGRKRSFFFLHSIMNSYIKTIYLECSRFVGLSNGVSFDIIRLLRLGAIGRQKADFSFLGRYDSPPPQMPFSPVLHLNVGGPSSFSRRLFSYVYPYGNGNSPGTRFDGRRLSYFFISYNYNLVKRHIYETIFYSFFQSFSTIG